jgi:hypothetical protein
MQYMDSVLRGKRWNGESLVDVERITCEAEEMPYTHFYMNDEELAASPYSIALQTFAIDHETRLETWRASSSVFAYTSSLLGNNCFQYTILPYDEDDGTSEYYPVLAVYTNDNTASQLFRQQVIDVPRCVTKTILAQIWFVTNLRNAIRSKFYAKALETFKDWFSVDSTLAELAANVGACFTEDTENVFITRYTKACAGIDMWISKQKDDVTML